MQSSFSSPAPSNRRLRLAISLGDPAGIGPEVVLKALADRAQWPHCELTLVGSRSLLLQTYQHLCDRGLQASLAHPDHLSLLEVEVDPATEGQVVVGEGNAASGLISFRSLDAAIEQVITGKCDGIVTAPIAKSAWKAAGFDYPGQTEVLAHRTATDRFGMMFVARSPHTDWTLRTLLATTHIPLRQVPDTLTPTLLDRKLELLLESLQQDFGITHPRIAIAGLNPHSGEQGQLGREELDWLQPWIEQTRQRLPHLQLDGPIPPDTMWVKPGQSWYGIGPERVAHDAYLALYHDQGLIPVKLMAFDRAVNTSIGLPFVRTSPDHGTAFDIAGQGIADATSMKAALDLAIELAHRRQPSPLTDLTPA